ncbi:uncharacterized protein LOC110440601 [Mizuhopecten yessoensis]|uniref:uncharacterized protein LOC110440601 n=1 Tax=Mizuhopecten yessoensis TaxID=6573 RepID=UPI000B45AC8F|nr:uncharacterized protein LOC110440601 [Mizuhopecten yessoensis]
MNQYHFFALCVLAAVCLLGIVGILFAKTSADDKQPSDVFDVSLSASLDIETTERNNFGSKKTSLKIEWNPAARKMNFHHTDVFSSDDDSLYELFFIKVEDKATVGISYVNSSVAFCIEDVTLPKWVDVLQHILTVDSWSRGKQSDGCRGDIWYTTYKQDIIEICTNDNQLEYVMHQKRRASVTSWTRTGNQNIHIRSDVLNGPCRDLRQKNYSKEYHIPVKTKRDSGMSPTTCLFVHGAGNNASGNDVLPDFSEYWGDVRNYTSNCASHKFLVYNSRDNGWDEDQIHQHFCDVAATNGTITNTVIFSHSMGNLVVGAALHRQRCTFNQATSHWFSVQGTWTGTVEANTLSNICRHPTWLQSPIRALLRAYGYCKPTENTESDVYTTLNTDYASPTGIGFDNLTDVGRRYVTGVMCGNSSIGLTTDYTESVGMFLLQYYSNLAVPNDGMVTLDSCKLKDEQFKFRSSNPYYIGYINHADGTCRNGGDPCSWYHHMHLS